jgi:hypothetical protein
LIWWQFQHGGSLENSEHRELSYISYYVSSKEMSPVF